ncbi:MAG: YCF48-related protein [Bacteroidota bacterium]
MKTLFIIPLLIILSFTAAFSQQYDWKTLVNSPMQSGRYEDISFINANQGWAVSGTSTLIRTVNGGESWDVLQAPAPYNVYFRCLSLVSGSKAFIGTLNSTTPLIVTSNSGKSFSAVSISGKKPSKVCGLFRVNQNIYGVGGYDGNATLVKSTNGGDTWTGYDMTSYAVSLVDVFFFNDTLGFTIGSADGSAYNSGKSVVLRTTNGGTSWEQVYKSTRLKEWGWKLFFISDSIGFVSIERRTQNPGGVFYLKTNDRGSTWNEQYFVQDYDVEGIGFANETVGWIGGWSGPTYQTLDSGRTWNLFSMSGQMQNLNRIRRINDTLMYGAGTQIYRYAPSSVLSVHSDNVSVPSVFTVFQNYPNPFNPNTTIEFTLPQFSTVRIFIYNSVGQLIEGIMDNPKPAGTYKLQWRPSAQLTSGVYFYQVQTEIGTVTHSMVYLK